MNKPALLHILIGLMLLVPAASVRAQLANRPEPAKRNSAAAPAAGNRSAAILAPFLRPSTFLVLHINVAQLDFNKLMPLLAEAGIPREQLAMLGGYMAAARQPYDQAGVKDLYIVSAPLEQWPAKGFNFWESFIAVVPVAEGADAEAIQRLMHGGSANPMQMPVRFAWEAAEVRDGVVIAGSKETLEHLRQEKPAERPELAAAFQAAGDAGARLVLLPPAGFDQIVREALGEPLPQLRFSPGEALARGLEWVAVGLDLPSEQPAGRLLIQSDDAQGAQQLQQLLTMLVDEGIRTGKIDPAFREFAQAAIPKAQDDQLTLRIGDDHMEPQIALRALNRAIANARERMGRAQSIQNLKQLALGMHVYHDVHKSFPPRAIADPSGKPLLSWRVALLPYLDQQQLYEQFRLDEPWDSEHNRKLIEKMPAVFATATAEPLPPGHTLYQVPVGPGSIFEGLAGTTIKEITDGTSNTILVVETDPSRAAVWTQPDDWEYSLVACGQGLGGLRNGVALAAMADGSVRPVETDDVARLAKLLQKSDGQAIAW